MSIHQKILPQLRAVQLIPAVHESLRNELKLPAHVHSVGLLSCDADDVAYIAADEATKQAQVDVYIGNSLYAGADHSSSPTAGEVIIALGGATPSEVQAGLNSMADTIRDALVAFRHADNDGRVAFLAHTVSSSGTYLSALAGVPRGQPLAYLIAPPVEALMGLDAALKAADVSMALYIPPPSETNYAGALLAGDEASCRAACEAFADAVIQVANNPVQL